jgi:hypothetical protein
MFYQFYFVHEAWQCNKYGWCFHMELAQVYIGHCIMPECKCTDKCHTCPQVCVLKKPIDLLETMMW